MADGEQYAEQVVTDAQLTLSTQQSIIQDGMHQSNTGKDINQ